MTSFDPAALAREIKTVQDRGGELVPFSSRFADFNLPSAYGVARRVHDLRLAEQALRVGRKIGFTNADMWDVYGVHAPVWGYIDDRTVVFDAGPTATCRIGRFAAPKIEPEIVVHFHRAPPANANPVELLACVDWVAHGIEIVQSHFPDWKFQAADTVADAALHAALLVGTPCPVGNLGANAMAAMAAMVDCEVSLSCNGQLRDTGRGRNVLGGPLSAVAHLLKVIGEQAGAAPIAAGEIVTTGTLTQAHAVQVGQVWTTAFDGIALAGLRVEFID